MLTFSPRLDGYYDVEDQLIDYLRRRAERCFRRREQERDAVRSLDALQEYRKRMRQHFLTAVGGLPEERTDLNARVTGVIDRGTFEIRKVIYDSVPEFPVTASLYMPKSQTSAELGPAVLFVCGHANDAKAYPTYQQVCIDLAQDGFVVLAMDPPGQGERFQFIDRSSGAQRVRCGTQEHSYVGMQYYLAGMSVAKQFIWDGIRGIDYLSSLPEVDAKRIGITGNSGGGTQSTFLMMSDPRLAAAMPCTFVMDYESYMKSGQAQDGEQNLFSCFFEGPGHDDFLTAMAPKPVRVGMVAYDFFPIEGALNAIEKAKKMYALFGAGQDEQLDYVIDQKTHQYSPLLRQSAVNFFRKALRGEEETFVTTEEETLSVEALRATETGQVLSSLKTCRTISDLVQDEVKQLAEDTVVCRDPETIRKQVAEVLGIGERVPEGEACWRGATRQRPIFPRIIDDRVVAGYRSEKIFFFTEADVIAAGVLIHPRIEGPAKGTEVLLLEGGTPEIPRQHPRLFAALEQGYNVFVFDVRGMGTLKTRQAGGNYGELGTEFKLGCDAFKMKTSTLGLRVFDVLRGLDYLRTRSDVGPLTLSGVGAASSWALYAAVLDAEVDGLSVEGMCLSFRELATTRFYESTLLDFRTMAWGLLRFGDVADLMPAIAPRPFRIIRPKFSDGLLMESEDFESKFIKPAEAGGVIGEQADGWRPVFV